jgi:hypothetical protein
LPPPFDARSAPDAALPRHAAAAVTPCCRVISPLRRHLPLMRCRVREAFRCRCAAAGGGTPQRRFEQHADAAAARNATPPCPPRPRHAAFYAMMPLRAKHAIERCRCRQLPFIFRLIYSFAAFHFRLRAAQQRYAWLILRLFSFFAFAIIDAARHFDIAIFIFSLSIISPLPFTPFQLLPRGRFSLAFPIRFFDTPLLAAFAVSAFIAGAIISLSCHFAAADFHYCRYSSLF